MKTISVILPCYNEEEALPLYFKSADPIIAEIPDYSFRFILVDDGSKDRTFTIMNELYEKRDDIEVVSLAGNYGQNAAIYAGLSVCKSDYAIVMDVDLQDPVELLKDFAKKFSEGYEIVSPRRVDRKTDGFFKRTTAKMFYRFANKLEGKEILPENVNMFRGFSKRVVDIINSAPSKDRLFLNDIARIGCKTCYINFTRHKRSSGTSKYNINKMFNHAFNIISSGTSRPLYSLIKVGAISTFITALIFIALLVTECVVNRAGFYPLITTFFIISAIFLGVSILIFVIGIIAIYLHNILLNSRNEPIFRININLKQEDKESTEQKKED